MKKKKEAWGKIHDAITATYCMVTSGSSESYKINGKE